MLILFSHCEFYLYSEQPSISVCTNTYETGELINVIFNGSAIRQTIISGVKHITQCVCDIKSGSSFQVTAADIRLVDAKNLCLTNAKVSGISKENIICSTNRATLSAVEMLRTEAKIGLSFDVPPEFMWIILQANTGMYM